MAHLLPIPLLTTPAAAFGIDDAGATAAAAWVFAHSELQFEFRVVAQVAAPW
jgi:hypothetical protein